MSDATRPVVPDLLAERVAAKPAVAPQSAPSPPQASAACPGMDEFPLADLDPNGAEPDQPDWDPDTVAAGQQMGPEKGRSRH